MARVCVMCSLRFQYILLKRHIVGWKSSDTLCTYHIYIERERRREREREREREGERERAWEKEGERGREREINVFPLRTIGHGMVADESVGSGCTVTGFPIAWSGSVTSLACEFVNVIGYIVLHMRRVVKSVLIYDNVRSSWSDPVWSTER